MSNSDGQVRIEVIANFDEVAKSANKCEKQINNFDASGLEKSFDNLDKTLNTLSLQFADFSKPVRQNENALLELENTIKSQYAEIEKLQNSYNDLTAELNKLKKPVDDNTNKFESLGKSYNTALVAQEKLFYAMNVNKSFKETSMAVNDAKERLRELAFQGDITSKEFQNLKQYVTEANKKFQETDTILSKNGLSFAASQTDNLTKTLGKLIGGLSALKIAQSTFQYIMQSVDAFRQEERSILALNTALANAGVYSQQYSIEIQQLASEIQSYSNYSNDVVIKAQALGQSFAGNTPITKELTKAVVDFAAATNKDLDSAFTLVGKSIGSSTNALGRYGVELNNNMTASEKATAIAIQLENAYTGQARNMADGNIQLKMSFDEVSKAIGSVFSPELQGIQNEFSKFANRLATLIKKVNSLREAWYKLNITISQHGIESLKRENYSDFEIQQQEARLKKYQKALQDLHKTQQNIKNSETIQNTENLSINNVKRSISTPTISGGKISGGSSAKSAKEVKDAFEQAQAEAQKAEKAFKLALYQSGGNVTPAVEQARLKMVDTKKAVEDVQKAFENLTAKAKTPFEQLNYNIEQSRQKIISIASQPIVNIEAIRQAQTEYQGFLAQQEQINSYLQPVKGAYQELNDKVSELTLNLKNLSAEHKVGTAEWINVQTQLKDAQTELDNVNKSLTDSGVKLEDYGKQISSSLSSGLVNALRNGGNAFDAFSNIAVSALQKVLDKLLEMSVVTPILNAFTGGSGGTIFSAFTKFFGSADGNVFKNGNVIPFAKGGVVNQPTIFPMANGGTGLMGEAGAEAVMPLRRMSNGRLGVEADTKGGQVVNIYNYSGANVETRKRDDNTMDVFIRRVNDALANERTSGGFRSAYSRENSKGVQAV